MTPLRTALIASLLPLGLATGCGGDCVPSSMKCPEGYVGYGRRLPNGNKDWLPSFAFADLSLWAAGDSFKGGGRCEEACVPAALGEPDRLNTCDAFQPCGGEVLGDWVLDAYACPYEVPVDMNSSCPEAVQSLAITGDGRLTFEPDGTLRFTSTTTDATEVIHLPASCIETLDSCADIAGVGEGCVGDVSQGCACAGESSGQGVQWEGTWQVLGPYLEITVGGVTREVGFCATDEGMILEWEPVSGSEVRERQQFIPFARGD